jgi:hypothetical protein
LLGSLVNDVCKVGSNLLLVLSDELLDEVDNLRVRACRELVADLVFVPVEYKSFAEFGLTGCLDRTGGGAALEARAFDVVSGFLLSIPFAFHVCGFLLFILPVPAVLAGMRFVGLGIFSSDFVLNRVTMSLKFGEPAFPAFDRTTGDEMLLLGGVCLYGET